LPLIFLGLALVVMLLLPFIQIIRDIFVPSR
jgi:hypothetical protein